VREQKDLHLELGFHLSLGSDWEPRLGHSQEPGRAGGWSLGGTGVMKNRTAVKL
jgi:hypothetical protein